VYYQFNTNGKGDYNMSKIQELIQSRLNELALIELQEERNEILKPETVGVSLRINSDSVDKLDLIAETLKLSRSDVMRSFLEAGASEALQALNLSVSEVVGFIEANEEKKALELHLEDENL